MKIFLKTFFLLFMIFEISKSNLFKTFKPRNDKKKKSASRSLEKRKRNKQKSEKLRRKLNVSSNLELPENQRKLDLEDKIFPNSGAIKIGEGKDYTPSGDIDEEKDAKKDQTFDQPKITDFYDKEPAYISYPDSVMAPAYKQGPIVISPQIMYPSIKKRVIVHHEQDFKTMYKNMLYRTHFYANMANSNPYYTSYMNKVPLENYPYYNEYNNMQSKSTVPSLPVI
jgi:hypothetical protein